MTEYRGTAERPIRPTKAVLTDCRHEGCSYALLSRYETTREAAQAAQGMFRLETANELQRHIDEEHGGFNGFDI